VRRLLPDPGPNHDAGLDDGGLVAAYVLPPGRSLRVNFITSLDGATTIDGRSGGLGTPGDLRIFRVLRALADVVLVGAGTANAEGYRAVETDSPVGWIRTSIGRPPTMPIAIVSRRASIDPTGGLVAGAPSPTILITCAAADPDRRAALAAAGVTVLVCGDDDVDLPTAVDRLAELGHEHVLCEGGATLLRSALTAGVVDELDLSIAPALVGSGPRLLDDLPGSPVRLDLRQLLEEDGVLFGRYRVQRPADQ
jgi:5-amino-6-(5-phosphoribosylamino)uracil reductase